MISSKITLGGREFFIVPQGFEFVTQSDVKFYGFHLSKKQVITCCEHFINMLQLLGYSDRLKSGFNFKCFKYFELSVYLHGLVSLYCSHFDYTCPPCFGIVRFSHLPHDVLKPEKKVKTIQCAKLEDPFGGSYYCCVISCIALRSQTLEGLTEQLNMRFPNFTEGCDIHFVSL